MRRSKRVLSKGKMFGFNPWMDQVHSINQIIEDTGEKSEASVLRELIDEGLAARRQKAIPEAEPAKPIPVEELAERLQAVQALLLRMITQGETLARIQGLSVELLQEVLAEAHVGRRVSWDYLAVSALEEEMSAKEIEKRFAEETEAGQQYAYRLAEEIKLEQDVEEKENADTVN